FGRPLVSSRFRNRLAGISPGCPKPYLLIGFASMLTNPSREESVHVAGGALRREELARRVFETLQERLFLRQQGVEEQPWRISVDPQWHEGNTLPPIN
ncbi:MAG: hypothetical protein ACOCUY_03815, partial [Verrucomicrobiota bacterium]